MVPARPAMRQADQRLAAAAQAAAAHHVDVQAGHREGVCWGCVCCNDCHIVACGSRAASPWQLRHMKCTLSIHGASFDVVKRSTLHQLVALASQKNESKERKPHFLPSLTETAPLLSNSALLQLPNKGTQRGVKLTFKAHSLVGQARGTNEAQPVCLACLHIDGLMLAACAVRDGRVVDCEQASSTSTTSALAQEMPTSWRRENVL